ncbi:MAG TPA: RluA family pseudouridine synthase [Casimicrobiaceae bacterium]|nr:RluA family pseudouridine synthase [Casimicrobiaceae bacterium]
MHYKRASNTDLAQASAVIELIVPNALAGTRLDAALARMLPEHSRTRIKSWIESGRVTVDGVALAPRHRLDGGEALVVAGCAGPTQTTDAPEAIDLRIVHEDEAILVVDKPAGLVVHPGAGNRAGTLLNALLHHAPLLASLPRAGIVHRLDKDTTGLMVVAKTPEAQTDLVRQLASRSVTREYLALACGDIATSVVVDAPIGRHPVQRTTMAVIENGKPARTYVEVLERHGVVTLVRCRLETGRTHQIRVHLASLGAPLVGDVVYGARRVSRLPEPLRKFPRQALHAERLALRHPETQLQQCFVAPLPADFRTLFEAIAMLRETS